MENQTAVAPDVYTLVTHQIIRQLEEGKVPWKKSWEENGIPKNLISLNPYRGLNVILLASLGYLQNYFLTLNQVKELGTSVKKGEKPHIVIFWNRSENQPERNGKNGKNVKNDVQRESPLKYYSVVNIAQCEEISPDIVPPITRQAHPITTCETILENMQRAPKIRHKDARAYYNPLVDYVNLPKKESFINENDYFKTLFHELIHATGHHSRLDRKDLIQMNEFGYDAYSHEELVAEIGTSYLCSLTGIVDNEISDSTYIKRWISKLERDKRLLFSAGTQAQKAIDFILNKQTESKDEVPF